MKMGFVTKADSNYFSGLKNLINSLQKTNPNIPITVFDCGLMPEQRNHISKLTHNIVDLKIDKYQVKEGDIGRFTSSIYAAMYLDKVDYEIIFHLDADVVVLDDLEHIFAKCQTEGFVGTSDYPPLSLESQILDVELSAELANQYPNINWVNKTFNGGVFCITRAFFDKLLLPKIQEYSHLHQKLKTNDQALLNLAYASLARHEFHDMGIHYNFRPSFSRATEIRMSEEVINANKILTSKYNDESIKILHFIREPKPWMEDFDKTSLPYKIWNQFSGM
jgi:lipopolysaccharide biosynthesis glycosyltransferase